MNDMTLSAAVLILRDLVGPVHPAEDPFGGSPNAPAYRKALSVVLEALPRDAKTKISWDWRSRPDLEDLQRSLGPFGIHVYQDPHWAKSDQFAYIFTMGPASESEIAAFSRTGHDD